MLFAIIQLIEISCYYFAPTGISKTRKPGETVQAKKLKS